MATVTNPRIPGLVDHDVLQLLGEGGMGKVFLARNKRTGKTVVVKTVHEHLVGDSKVRQRFRQEIDMMEHFKHPNAVTLYQAAPAAAEFPYFVMEFVPGVSLDAMLQKEGRFKALRAGCFLAPLCLFLQSAHDSGLLHRDLTPANIMVTDVGTPRENIKVMDFGLARRIGFYIPAGQLKEGDGAIDGGTPDFVCPEQILGRQVDHRGDLFSVGVLMYALLTGHLPFEALSDPMDILAANLQEEPPAFKQWNVFDVPAGIEKLVLSCIAKKPADRPVSAKALIEAYQKAVGHAFVSDDDFTQSMDLTVSTLLAQKRFDPRSIIDRFEASMMEQVAAMKLRGFVSDVGGEVADSDAGVIKFKLPRTVEVETKKAFWNVFTPAVQKQTEWIPLELHMSRAKGSRAMVDITVVRPLPPDETPDQAKIRKLFCDLYCCELRAYLMVGR